MANFVKTAVTLTQEQLDLLDRLAQRPGMFQDRSRAWLIRYAIDKTFKEMKAEDTDDK